MVPSQTTRAALNPYQSPNAITEDGPPKQNGEAVGLGAVIRTWELLRIVYNVALMVFVFTISWTVFFQDAKDPLYWACIVFGGIISNLCYCLGPAIEAYGRYLSIWHFYLTVLLFGAGLGFTALMAVMAIESFTPLP